MLAEMGSAVAQDDDDPHRILADHLVAIWQHTAEAYAEPAVYAALTSDFGPVPLPDKA